MESKTASQVLKDSPEIGKEECIPKDAEEVVCVGGNEVEIGRCLSAQPMGSLVNLHRIYSPEGFPLQMGTIVSNDAIRVAVNISKKRKSSE